MSGRYLLDINIVVALFGGDESVRKRIVSADEVFLSVVSLGELFFGALCSTHVTENLERIDSVIDKAAILECDAATAREYAAVKADVAIGR